MVSVLFVCMGNICRSPTAEGVMLHLVKKAHLEEKISIDSAGIIAYHAGERADRRMREHSIKRGIELHSIARQFQARTDFQNFDYIIVMDKRNFHEIEKLDPEHKYMEKVFMMADFCQSRPEKEVPDPYYGGEGGFEQVIDIVTDGCEGLLSRIMDEI
jgi:protein-tyrosine phosphatase